MLSPMDTASQWGNAPLFAAMYVLVVTVWAICVPSLQATAKGGARRWFLGAALFTAGATAIVGTLAMTGSTAREAEDAALTAQTIAGIVFVIGAFITVGLGLPRALWILSKPLA